jgi:hypothetical protein
VARPDRIRKIQLFWLIDLMPPCWCVINTIPHAMITTTIVRIAVARLELTPSIPTFASIDVSAAKTADPSANPNHIRIPPFILNRRFAGALIIDPPPQNYNGKVGELYG